jgi:hypothetical protein
MQDQVDQEESGVLMPETRQTDTADPKVRLKFARRSGGRGEADDLRRRHAEVKITEYIQRLVAQAPQLTEDQKDQLRSLVFGRGW